MLFISYANESSRLDENLPARSQFYSDHRVNLSTYRYCQSATFGSLTFCVCSLFFTILNKKEFRIATVAMFTPDLNAGVVPQMSPPAHDLERLRTTMVDFIVLSIKLVFMVLGVSYSRVLAQRPTGCCSASMYNLSLYCGCCHVLSRSVARPWRACFRSPPPTYRTVKCGSSSNNIYRTHSLTLTRNSG